MYFIENGTANAPKPFGLDRALSAKPRRLLMKNAQDVPLYIGKAINLKSRVKSYFFDTHADRPHIPVMLQRLDHIEWIATNNESEALILEAQSH